MLRVLPVYMRPEHVRDVVRRCPNHVAAAVRDAGLQCAGETEVQAQHLIRSQHALAKYLEDPGTRRLSVLVPFELPQGQSVARQCPALLQGLDPQGQGLGSEGQGQGQAQQHCPCRPISLRTSLNLTRFTYCSA